jgi:hypothetical protein
VPCLGIAYYAVTVAGYLYDFSQINVNRKWSRVIRSKPLNLL